MKTVNVMTSGATLFDFANGFTCRVFFLNGAVTCFTFKTESRDFGHPENFDADSFASHMAEVSKRKN